jgi:hypothetical protein
MRKTRKHNKIYRKTRRGGGKGNLKIVPPLPPSPPPTPPSSPISNRKPEIKVGIKNLESVKEYTYNWYKRRQPRIELEKIRKPTILDRIFGRKIVPPKPVTVNSRGEPVRSAFPLNNKNNRGFKPNS